MTDAGKLRIEKCMELDELDAKRKEVEQELYNAEANLGQLTPRTGP